MSDLYPEHTKLSKVHNSSQEIGEFLAWASEQGLFLAKYQEETALFARAHPHRESTQELLARFFEIDLKQLDVEKRQILDNARQAPVST